MEGWVKVYTSYDIFSTEMLRQVLESNQIKVVCMNRKDSIYLFGEIELYVPQTNFTLAIEIIISLDLEI
jgi:hypothetical protein